MPPKPQTSGLNKSTKGQSNPSQTPGAALRRSQRSSTTASASTTSSPLPMSSSTPSSSKPQPSTPVYFWRPHDPNGYLGQWYSSPFTVAGDTYATAEMYMMVSKARLFADEDIARKMLDTTDPKTHKALGRKVRGFDGRVWDQSMYNFQTKNLDGNSECNA